MIEKDLYKNQRVAIFVDVQNMYYSAKSLFNKKINYNWVLRVAINGRILVRAIAYVIKADMPEENSFFDALKKIGFEVRLKELKTFYSGAKKGDWDMEIALDAINIAPKVDVVVLISGDGDFTGLVKHLKTMGVRVEVMAWGKSTASSLIEEVHQFTDMEKQKKKFLMK